MNSRSAACGADQSNLHRLPILNDQTWPRVAKKLCLTPRQAEIVYLVLQAKKDKEVAAALDLGVSTVRMHLRYVYNQMGITDRVELALAVFHAVCQECDGNACLSTNDVSEMT